MYKIKCLLDGVLFAPPNNPNDPQSSDAANDYLGYFRAAENVDLTFACRWFAGNILNKISI